MRALILLLLAGCAGRAPAEAPSWQKKAVGGDCEVSFAMSVPEASVPGSKIVKRGVGELERLSNLKVPTGKRIELCAKARPDQGSDWILVVREIALAEATRLSSSGEHLPSGAARSRAGSASFFVWKRTWALVSEGAAERVQHFGEDQIAAPIALPPGTVGALSIRGEAARRLQERLPDARFLEATAELRLNGDHVTLRARVQFESEADARRLAESLEDAWRRAGDEAARGETTSLAKLRRDGELRADRDGTSVEATLDVWEEGQHPLSPAASATPGTYHEACPAGQRLDLDRKSCVP